MTNGKPIEIKPAKGQPMLTWVGKRPLRNVMAYPAQLVESYTPALLTHVKSPSEMWADWPEDFPKGGLLFHGDNKDILAYLLANGFRGKVKLIYIDPPFDSGADYIRKVELRGSRGVTKVEGEGYELGEQIQYTDIWSNDNYLQFMYERLMLLRELLSENGTLFLHCDDTKNHHLRCLLDEIFSPDNFLNEVIHCYGEREKIQKTFNRKHQTIFWYAKNKNDGYVFNPEDVREEFAPGTITKYRYVDEQGRPFRIRGKNQEAAGPLRAKTDLKLEDECEYTYRDYLDDRSGPAPRDWFVKPFLNQAANERESYPTQKNSEVIEKFIIAASKPGDIILDCFVGSGTAVDIAQKLGRRWIAADINKGAIQITSERLQVLIQNQISAQPLLPKLDNKLESELQPAQLSFSIYRVNDYDLQIQHNEALNLACEHIGITRTRTDVFFDGTLGKELVKIIPFNHPLTLLDLEEVHKELHNRPEEERNIVIVCLGRELATFEWIEEWNKNRKRTGLPNQVRVIEVRSDPKYGGLFIHKPDEAEVNFKRTPEGTQIEIANFISPTIVERLKQQAGIVTPQIEDWRAMVDSVMIDTAYNGEVFNIVLADIPEKKSDLVVGKYVLPAQDKPTTIAVKITDMLGEEVLIVDQP